eukprot:scaffold543_cov119-Cylindrotheca_fusiformis.AAC.2
MLLVSQKFRAARLLYFWSDIKGTEDSSSPYSSIVRRGFHHPWLRFSLGWSDRGPDTTINTHRREERQDGPIRSNISATHGSLSASLSRSHTVIH